MIHLVALLLGFCLDVALGDPRGIPHLVVGIGRLIGSFEKPLRRLFPKTPAGELWGGGVLVLLVCAAALGLPLGLLWLCGLVHPLLQLAVESLLCWQCIAMRDLRAESMQVYSALEAQDLPAARRAVGMIVGRDTQNLTEEEIARATVETVAENTGDGVVAPIFYMAIGGAALGVLYKAINTMDSMLGYKNDQYLYFGRAAALLDDAANYIPARLCALAVVAGAALSRFSARDAFRVWRRDHANHKSPNSAHPEAAYAGAMGLQMGGDSCYFGQLVRKPTIGDDTRAIQPDDIPRACRLLYVTTFLWLALCTLLKLLALWLLR